MENNEQQDPFIILHPQIIERNFFLLKRNAFF